MKEIVVLSGKGGTGKTSVTAAFACLGAQDVCIADCDVDAADMHLLMKPDHLKKKNFYSGEVAVVDENKCSACGLCMEYCKFDAIEIKNAVACIEPLKCEGCGLCSRICPENAIHNEKVLSGESYVSRTRFNNIMVHARLAIGAANSGKLVAEVKDLAKKQAEKDEKELILVDGSPGIGCPVISSLSGASLVIIVVEASLSGFSDMKRLVKLIDGFHIPAGCIINKSNLNKEVRGGIRNYLQENNIRLLGEIPYTDLFTKAVLEGKTVVEMNDDSINEILNTSWKEILQILKQDIRL